MDTLNSDACSAFHEPLTGSLAHNGVFSVSYPHALVEHDAAQRRKQARENILKRKRAEFEGCAAV